MSKDIEIIDDIYEEDRTFFFSKLSIIITSIILSPYFGAILYSCNLYFTKQSNKIFGSILSIYLLYFIVIVGLLGFEFNRDIINPIFVIAKLAVILFICGPLWHRHFEGVKFQTRFPWVIFTSMFLIYYMNIYYEYLIYTNYDLYTTPPLYFIRFNLFSITVIVLLASITKIIINLFATIYNKISSKKEQ